MNTGAMSANEKGEYIGIYNERRGRLSGTYCVFLLNLQFKVDSPGSRSSHLKLWITYCLASGPTASIHKYTMSHIIQETAEQRLDTSVCGLGYRSPTEALDPK